MFVAASCDCSSDDRLCDFTNLSEKLFDRLKKDTDRPADSRDTLRLHPYPLEDALAIASLKGKIKKEKSGGGMRSVCRKALA